MAAVEIVMMRKYSVAILFFCHVDSGMFFYTFYTEQCNVTVLQLKWYDSKAGTL